jgi:hypothetical protein
MVHSPTWPAAAGAYESFVRFTLDPVREAFGFQFLLEFLVVDELLVSLGLSLVSRFE